MFTVTMANENYVYFRTILRKATRYTYYRRLLLFNSDTTAQSETGITFEIFDPNWKKWFGVIFLFYFSLVFFSKSIRVGNFELTAYMQTNRNLITFSLFLSLSESRSLALLFSLWLCDRIVFVSCRYTQIASKICSTFKRASQLCVQ